MDTNTNKENEGIGSSDLFHNTTASQGSAVDKVNTDVNSLETKKMVSEGGGTTLIVSIAATTPVTSATTPATAPIENIRLEKVEFNEIGFRKLKDITIPIGKRLTAIAGHNGIGKSTILGLIANCTASENKGIAEKNLQSEFSEIFFLDYS